MKIKKLITKLLVVLLMVFCLVSCGDEQDVDTVKPTVSLDVVESAYAGDEITIKYTASDDVTAKEDLVIEISVLKDGKEVALNDNKFICQEGEYVVTITVTDEASNSNSDSKTIVVSVLDETKPRVTINLPDEANVGDEIVIDYVIEDDSDLNLIDVQVLVKHNGVELGITDNKFICEEGTYEITVTATDESNNVGSASKTLVVENKIDLSYREDRNLVEYGKPDNLTKEEELPLINELLGQEVVKLDDLSLAMVSGDYRLDFVKVSDKYVLQLVKINEFNKTSSVSSDSDAVMFINNNPVIVYLQGSKSELTGGYDQVNVTDYGICATASITSNSGTTVDIKDCYYFAKEGEVGAFNVRKTVRIAELGASDTGFASEYGFANAQSGSMQWFVPNIVYNNYKGTVNIYRETTLGVPMIMMRNSSNGYTLSISRYQPIITYQDNSYATFELNNTNREIVVSYPSNEANRKYHTAALGAQHVYDLTVRAEDTESFNEAMPSVYNAHFNLQNQRIVNTDIDEIYKVICEDYKTFLHATEQEDEINGKKYTSYGLPWRITIEDGEFGPLTYQAGFIGQQIPSAYNMMLYGIMNDDLVSLQNGINVIDFWVEDAEFMSIAGVPYIWYDTWSDGFRSYPCFLRMAVDAMEGLLDAYLLAAYHGLDKSSWYEALALFGSFLITNQNEDGSYYRCYNYDGGPYNNWDNGIEEPPNNICQSDSKANTPMAIRFLGKMYELTGDETYKEAAIKAGEFTYENLYNLSYYQGGTCDNPNAIDKEAGVFAMYAYDTLYMLTGDEKWVECLKQATAFTMSTVLIYSFGVKESDLKSGLPVYAGYTDGMSFITCHSGSGVDNYIAYIYYELFRVYIITGDETYYKQAEFIQQNTKSIMNWDGALGYKYKSLVAEASTIHSFNYSSASDGAWVTWSSVANAEPIAKMYNNFGCADVAYFKNTDIEVLREILNSVGCGGKTHTIYENTVISQVE